MAVEKELPLLKIACASAERKESAQETDCGILSPVRLYLSLASKEFTLTVLWYYNSLFKTASCE